MKPKISKKSKDGQIYSRRECQSLKLLLNSFPNIHFLIGERGVPHRRRTPVRSKPRINNKILHCFTMQHYKLKHIQIIIRSTKIQKFHLLQLRVQSRHLLEVRPELPPRPMPPDVCGSRGEQGITSRCLKKKEVNQLIIGKMVNLVPQN